MDALKEWATVVHALENGEQTVILRKGGILETVSGFKIEAKKFLLFPTFEHQEIKIHIRSEYHGCKSWININEDIQGGKPVLSDTELNSRFQKFKEIVN